jgi:spore germination cell wall hydrolase CwlJ-like protein
MFTSKLKTYLSKIKFDLFKQTKDFPYLRLAEGFLIGAVVIMFIAVLTPPKIETVEVPVEVEKEVIVREPVYLNRNDRQQIACMAENAYFEAGHEPTEGIIAVNNVVMNRVEDSRFPNTPCGVINQRTSRVCQFSWRCEGHKRVTDMAAFRRAREIAENVYIGNYGDVTGGAQFYHANYVNPSWSRIYDRTVRIGAHIFYEG